MLQTVCAAGDSDAALFASIGISSRVRERLCSRARLLQPSPEPLASVGLPRKPGIRRRARLPGRRDRLATRSVCQVVRALSGEMILLVTGRAGPERDTRFAVSHIRQISMYVCHVVLQMTMTDIAGAFGKDRTTVGYACARVEDRRDDHGYDYLIACIERAVAAVFMPKVCAHG